jgi:hypothetical protein
LKQPAYVWLALAAVIGTGVALRSVHMTDVTSRSPDERFYTLYASQTADSGLLAYRKLFSDYDNSAVAWPFPAPTRFGFAFLSAGVMKVTGIRDARAGAAISWVFSCLSLLLVAWMGLRFFNPWVALAGTAFMASCFGELGTARRAWQDSTFGFCGLLLIWITCEITRTPRRAGLYWAFFAAGTYSILIKESSLLSYGLCLVWVLGLAAIRERSPRLSALVVTGGIASAVISLVVWSALAGSPHLALSVLGHELAFAAGPYAHVNYSGPWYQFFYLLWLVGPSTAAMAAVGAFVALSGHGWSAARLLLLIASAFILFASFGPDFQYLRIMSPANGAYCLLAGLGLCRLVSMARTWVGKPVWLAPAIAATYVLASGVGDYTTFTSVVVRSGMEDLAVKGIRNAMGR